MRLTYLPVVISLVIAVSAGYMSLSSHAAVNDAALKIKWGYKGNIGPQFWGQLSPGFAMCANGRWQSPINIPTDSVIQSANQLDVHYDSAPMFIAENGSVPLGVGKDQTIMSTGKGVQLYFHTIAEKMIVAHASTEDQKLLTEHMHHDLSHEFIKFAGADFHLVQLHFHSPSENEWHDQSYPLEIHLVHQGEDGRLAVMGIFVKGGEPNPILQKIIDHFPPNDGKEHEITNERINPADLLPIKKDYYSFQGSLTTPPCAEGVQWILFADTITASPAQILKLRAEAGGENARPVQLTHHRPILYSTEK